MKAQHFIATLLLVAVAFFAGKYTSGIDAVNSKGTLNYEAVVCVDVIKKTGEIIDLGCQHNLLVDQGKDYILELMSGIDQTGATPGTDFAKYISLSNSSQAPDASWTVIPDEITTGGLERAEATCTRNGVGNWTCEYTFTASQSFTNVQLTGLNWNGTAGANTLVAAAQFSPVNLDAGDNLKVKWTITIS